MAYLRDGNTGRFKWVKDAAGDDGAEGPARGGAKPAPSPAAILLAAGILAAIVLIGAWGIHSYRHPSIAIRRIYNHPAEFDGQTVVLRGQVGSVFPVGGSYAYYLRQGRDTIVVFTRGERPTPGPDAEVRGSISIGYLDGVARPALFAAE